ncbi:phosphotransferase enzyme family protein [Teratosphaeria destructans]|uniref:Phosphotransferase enzyme family protein n=1 Tax=Teratosphaeria destructans TaxID=418781 RepID=A0A9W7SZB7_9PEZI|nr:phosphotransferase enzyme family protein [Teratosphaeria destructans]
MDNPMKSSFWMLCILIDLWPYVEDNLTQLQCNLFSIGPGEYFRSLVAQQKTHLWTQRNLCDSPNDAHDRYISNHLFAQLVDRHCIDDRGPIKLFCDDFRPQNIIVDPTTLGIKAVLDLEFTTAMPSQFASEPPWWLSLAGPDSYLVRGLTLDHFVEAYMYEPRLDQFLAAMEQAEKTHPAAEHHKPLSRLMRESWRSKRFWFNYAARKPFDIDDIFNDCLKDGNASIESLDEETRAGLDAFVEAKMKQLKAYDTDCARHLESAG